MTRDDLEKQGYRFLTDTKGLVVNVWAPGNIKLRSKKGRLTAITRADQYSLTEFGAVDKDTALMLATNDFVTRRLRGEEF